VVAPPGAPNPLPYRGEPPSAPRRPEPLPAPAGRLHPFIPVPSAEAYAAADFQRLGDVIIHLTDALPGLLPARSRAIRPSSI